MYEVLLFLLVVVSFLIVLFLYDLTRVFFGAPFVLTPVDMLSKISKQFEMPTGSVFYEPGCGDARITCAVAGRNPLSRCIGLDRSFTAYLTSFVRAYKSGLSNVSIRRKNMFEVDFSDGTHFFLWLYPRMLPTLLQKIQTEVRKPVVVVSMDFKLEGIEPSGIVPLNYAKKNYAQNLYIYTIYPR